VAKGGKSFAIPCRAKISHDGIGSKITDKKQAFFISPTQGKDKAMKGKDRARGQRRKRTASLPRCGEQTILIQGRQGLGANNKKNRRGEATALKGSRQLQGIAIFQGG